MKINLPLAIFIFSFTNSFSQTGYIIGVVKNTFDEPIPYVHIVVKNAKKGTNTDEEGFFSLSSSGITDEDSVSVSVIGYEKYLCSFNEFRRLKTITLNKRAYELTSISVVPNQSKNMVLGDYSSYQDSSISYFGLQWIWKWGTKFTKYFPNDDIKSGTIKTVSLFIHDLGKSKAPFRIIVMDTDSISGLPGRDILKKDLIVKGAKKGEWLEIDLTDQQIEIPKNGFFVGMEWIHLGKKKLNGNRNKNIILILMVKNPNEKREFVSMDKHYDKG